MPDCPFLSTFDNDVECFRECALYNYKETGGKCPFTPVVESKTVVFHDYDAFKFDGEKELINSLY
jgi:hypothetical protein